jgi:hypothetical protein
MYPHGCVGSLTRDEEFDYDPQNGLQAKVCLSMEKYEYLQTFPDAVHPPDVS